LNKQPSLNIKDHSHKVIRVIAVQVRSLSTEICGEIGLNYIARNTFENYLI
jgi:hypothetical protein